MNDVTRWMSAIAADGALIAATAADDLDRPVPTCPDWTVRDLIVHLGAVHRWAARFVGADAESTERFGFDTSDVPDGPAVTGWYSDRLAELVGRLQTTDPEKSVRGFGIVGPARFWFRRQAHETAMHRWDLQNALPAGPAPIDAALAVDGIAEWFEVFVPRVLRRAELPAVAVGAVVGVRPSDGDGCTFRLAADGAVSDPEQQPTVVMRGTASDLLLALWRRTSSDDVTVYGDTPVIDALLDTIRV